MVLPANIHYGGLGSDLSGLTAIVADHVVNRATWKRAVRVAATGNLDVAATLVGSTVDGVTLAVGDRVLAWQQTLPAENGVYVVDATPFRSADFDASEEIVAALVSVTAGTVYAGAVFQNTNTAAVTVGTDAITFELLSTPPGGAAGGDFEGTFPNPTLKYTAVRDAGRWEVVMDPATSSPPVAVETPDGTDWVYGWVL
jgi:hypothetical protein